LARRTPGAEICQVLYKRLIIRIPLPVHCASLN
jgi:hypothetical protein